MKKIYREIHLWLSVPFGIIITLVCFSGSMLVFEKEITELCRPEVYYVSEVKEKTLPIDEIMQTVSASLPDTVTAKGITISPDKNRTWQVSLSKPRRASIYVNPYTAEITGKNERLAFFDTMFRLHRWLLGSSSSSDGSMPIGKLIVGISVIMLVIIIISGLLIWLGYNKKTIKKSLKISVTKGWRRFWHDLHVAGGIYAAVIILVMALTGLTWSFSWYRTGFYSLCGGENTAHNKQTNQGTQDGKSNKERNKDKLGNHSQQGERREGREHKHRNPYRQWQNVYELIAKENPGYRQITLSDTTVSVVAAGQQSLRASDKYGFNKRTGEITSTQLYDNQDKASKVRSWVYMLHVGSWGGMVTRILWFLVSLFGATLPITGYYLWIKRIYKQKH